jgi:hypothetical protein
MEPANADSNGLRHALKAESPWVPASRAGRVAPTVTHALGGPRRLGAGATLHGDPHASNSTRVTSMRTNVKRARARG